MIMDYEKAYKEALKKIQELINKANKQGHIIVRVEDIENSFPELKESEDERIRNVIRGWIYTRPTSFFDNGISKEEMLAWLEKQGEQKPTIEMKSAEESLGIDSATYNKIVDEVIYGEQKDFAPKFNTGDWVVISISDGEKVVRIDTIEYFKSGKPKYITSEGRWFGNGTTAHRWTIQDAKEGDTVINKSDGTIGIFESIGHHPDGGGYNDPSYCFLHCRYDDGFFYADFENGNTIDADDLIPATKEQRDLLFQKMHEAGYEWDEEKKEVKKIKKQVPKPKWTDNDEEKLRDIIIAIHSVAYQPTEVEEERIEWLKSIKQRIG